VFKIPGPQQGQPGADGQAQNAKLAQGPAETTQGAKTTHTGTCQDPGGTCQYFPKSGFFFRVLKPPERRTLRRCAASRLHRPDGTGDGDGDGDGGGGGDGRGGDGVKMMMEPRGMTATITTTMMKVMTMKMAVMMIDAGDNVNNV